MTPAPSTATASWIGNLFSKDSDFIDLLPTRKSNFIVAVDLASEEPDNRESKLAAIVTTNGTTVEKELFVRVLQRVGVSSGDSKVTLRAGVWGSIDPLLMRETDNDEPRKILPQGDSRTLTREEREKYKGRVHLWRARRRNRVL